MAGAAFLAGAELLAAPWEQASKEIPGTRGTARDSAQRDLHVEKAPPYKKGAGLPARAPFSFEIGMTDSTFGGSEISARVGVRITESSPVPDSALRHTLFFDPSVHTLCYLDQTASRVTGCPFTVDPTQKEEVRPARDVL